MKKQKAAVEDYIFPWNLRHCFILSLELATAILIAVIFVVAISNNICKQDALGQDLNKIFAESQNR